MIVDGVRGFTESGQFHHRLGRIRLASAHVDETKSDPDTLQLAVLK